MPDDEHTTQSFESRLDDAIDAVLDVLTEAEKYGVELDPLATIVGRMRARGEDLNLDDAPPLLKMLLAGIDA